VQYPVDAKTLAMGDHPIGELHVRLVEGPAGVATLVEYADEVDDGIAALHRRAQPQWIVDVDFDELHGGNDQQFAMALAVARKDSQPIAVTVQAIGEMPPDKAAAA
jgi:hypothetical protein